MSKITPSATMTTMVRLGRSTSTLSMGTRILARLSVNVASPPSPMTVNLPQSSSSPPLSSLSSSSTLWIALCVLLLDERYEHRTVLVVLLWLVSALQNQAHVQQSLSVGQAIAQRNYDSWWSTLVFAGTILSDSFDRWDRKHGGGSTAQEWSRLYRPKRGGQHDRSICSLPFPSGSCCCLLSKNRYCRGGPSIALVHDDDANDSSHSLRRRSAFSTIPRPPLLRGIYFGAVVARRGAASIAPCAWLALLADTVMVTGQDGESSSQTRADTIDSVIPSLLFVSSWLFWTSVMVGAALDRNHSRITTEGTIEVDSLDHRGPVESRWTEWTNGQLLEWVERYYDCHEEELDCEPNITAAKTHSLGLFGLENRCGAKHLRKDQDEVDDEEEETDLNLVLRVLARERIQGHQLPDCLPLLSECLPLGVHHRLDAMVRKRLYRPYCATEILPSSSSRRERSRKSHKDSTDTIASQPVADESLFSNDTGRSVEGSIFPPPDWLSLIPNYTHSSPTDFLKGTVELMNTTGQYHEKDGAQPREREQPHVGSHSSNDATTDDRPTVENSHISLLSDASVSGWLPPHIAEIVRNRPDLVQHALEIHRRRRHCLDGANSQGQAQHQEDRLDSTYQLFKGDPLFLHPCVSPSKSAFSNETQSRSAVDESASSSMLESFSPLECLRPSSSTSHAEVVATTTGPYISPTKRVADPAKSSNFVVDHDSEGDSDEWQSQETTELLHRRPHGGAFTAGPSHATAGKHRYQSFG